MTDEEIIALIKQEVKPALGCTEPIAVALAVAKAAEIISENATSSKTAWAWASPAPAWWGCL